MTIKVGNVYVRYFRNLNQQKIIIIDKVEEDSFFYSLYFIGRRYRSDWQNIGRFTEWLEDGYIHIKDKGLIALISS